MAFFFSLVLLVLIGGTTLAQGVFDDFPSQTPPAPAASNFPGTSATPLDSPPQPSLFGPSPSNPEPTGSAPPANDPIGSPGTSGGFSGSSPSSIGAPSYQPPDSGIDNIGTQSPFGNSSTLPAIPSISPPADTAYPIQDPGKSLSPNRPETPPKTPRSPSKPSSPKPTPTADSPPATRRSSPTGSSSPPQPDTKRSPTAVPERKPAAPRQSPPNELPKRTVRTATEPSTADIAGRPELLRSVMTPGHPFDGLLELPRDPDCQFQGEALSLAELLRSQPQPVQRRQLLHAYWNGVGMLAKYNLLLLEEKQIADWQHFYQRETTANPDFRKLLPVVTAALKQSVQRRKVAELDCARLQYELITIMNPGALIRTEAEPGIRNDIALQGERPAVKTGTIERIPNEYPLVLAYATQIDAMRTVVSMRARLLDRELPLQHRIMLAEQDAAAAASEFLNAVASAGSSTSDSIAALREMTAAKMSLVDAVIAYNRMIADYTSETVGADVSLYQLLGVLVKLPTP